MVSAFSFLCRRIISMKNRLLYLLFTAYCLLPVLLYSQDSSGVKIPNDTSSFYAVEMNDGSLLTGKIIEKKDKELSFRDSNTGTVILKIRKIASIDKIRTDGYFIFYMKDGAFLHGRILRYNETEIGIETKDVGTRTVPLNRVKEMRQIEEKDLHGKGKYWYPDRNAVRYFFGPSAVPLAKNDGYFQNADLVVNSASYGITSNFSLQAGAVVPFAVFLMPKFGCEVKKNLHVGGGLFYGRTLLKFRNANYKMGAAYGLATFGTHNTHLTFGLGYGFTGTDFEMKYPDKPMMTLGGTARISRRFALVTEHVIFPMKICVWEAKGEVCSYDYRAASSYGFRLVKENTAVDFAFMTLPQELIEAFVFVGITFRF